MTEASTLLDDTLRHFLATGAWPTLRSLQLQYGPQTNVRLLAAQFGQHLIVCEDGKVSICRLTLECMAAMPEAEPVRTVYARALRHIAEFARAHTDAPVDKSALKQALDLSERELGYIAMMIRYGGGPWSLSSYSNDGTQFSVTPNDDALFYSDVESYADVLAVQNRLHSDKRRISELLTRQWQEPRQAQPRVAPDTQWEKVNRQVRAMRDRLVSAKTEEEYQTVGLLCREALASLAETAHSFEQHPTTESFDVSRTDTKRRLDAFFEAELAGASNEQARKHAKAAVSLADALVHKRTADYRTAALCAEATTSVVTLANIVVATR